MLRPYRASILVNLYPGRCPGLVCCRPFRAKKKNVYTCRPIRELNEFFRITTPLLPIELINDPVYKYKHYVKIDYQKEKARKSQRKKSALKNTGRNL